MNLWRETHLATRCSRIPPITEKRGPLWFTCNNTEKPQISTVILYERWPHTELQALVICYCLQVVWVCGVKSWVQGECLVHCRTVFFLVPVWSSSEPLQRRAFLAHRQTVLCSWLQRNSCNSKHFKVLWFPTTGCQHRFDFDRQCLNTLTSTYPTPGPPLSV